MPIGSLLGTEHAHRQRADRRCGCRLDAKPSRTPHRATVRGRGSGHDVASWYAFRRTQTRCSRPWQRLIRMGAAVPEVVGVELESIRLGVFAEDQLPARVEKGLRTV